MIKRNGAKFTAQTLIRETRPKRSILRIGSIRTRLLIAFVLMVLLAAIAVSSVTFVLGSREAKQHVISQLESVVTLKEAEIEAWIKGLRVNLDIVLSSEGVLNDISQLTLSSVDLEEHDALYNRLQELFKWAAERMGLFEELFLMDSQGRVLLSTNTAHEGEIHSIYDYFIEGLEDYYIQQPSYSLSLGKMIVVVSSPVEYEGTLLGVLAGRASLESLNAIMLERTGLGDAGETYLVGSNHQLVTGLRVEGYDIPETYIRTMGADSAISNNASGSATYQNYGGDSVIGVYRWIPGLRLALLAEQEEAEALHTTRVALAIIGGVAAGAVVLAILAAIFLTRSIVRPLSELADTAVGIAAGDLDRAVKVERADEIGTVAKAFNNMTSQLRSLVRNLEQRTDQLRTINEVGRKISSILALDELLPFIVGSLQEAFEYYNVNILLIDKTTDELVLKAGAGGYRGIAPVGLRVKVGEGIVGWVTQSGQPLRVDDVRQEPRYCHIKELPDTRSELAVPLKVGTDILGVLDIESAEFNAFDETDVFTVETLAGQLAVAIKNAQLYEEAGELAAVEERQRLARDLHDAVTQTLFSVSLIADVLPRLWQKDAAEGQRRLEELRQLTRGALAEMRLLLLELRPAALTEVGLSELLRQLTAATTSRSQLPFSLTLEGKCDVPTEVQIAFYRVAQEALNNILKHSSATKAIVHLTCQTGMAKLTISDNGSGFNPQNVSPDHLGLHIMRERAETIGASLKIESQLGHGTQVVVVWQNPQRKESL